MFGLSLPITTVNLAWHFQNGLTKRLANTSITQTLINLAGRSFVRWVRRVGCGLLCRQHMAGLSEKLDVRTLCAAREILAWYDSLADFAFAMQGLGTGSISLFGNDETKANICRRCATAFILRLLR